MKDAMEFVKRVRAYCKSDSLCSTPKDNCPNYQVFDDLPAALDLIESQSEELCRFYHSDGTFDVLPSKEVKRRRIDCAGVVESSRRVRAEELSHDNRCDAIMDLDAALRALDQEKPREYPKA